jgi:hypothetical protein
MVAIHRRFLAPDRGARRNVDAYRAFAVERYRFAQRGVARSILKEL